MGGQAFRHVNPPLPTPRIPPHIYKHIRDMTLETLREHYKHARTPIEAPGKTDFGDLDILLHGPLLPEFDPSNKNRELVTLELAKLLGAKKYIVGPGGQAIQLAVPYPKMAPYTELAGMADGDLYLQVDIHVCKDLQNFEWDYFHASHGDLWNILGTMIRRFGLTVNNKGMYIRNPEIEAHDKKKSMILLTECPEEILLFLGLDSEKWFQPFADLEDMFNYAAGCRFFYIPEEAKEADSKEIQSSVDDGLLQKASVDDENLLPQPVRKKLKASDEKRFATRPIFREWIEIWLPKLQSEGKVPAVAPLTREQVREEAFAKFGIKEAYETRQKEWLMERHLVVLWKDVIKGSVEEKDPQRRGATCKEFKEIIVDGGKFCGDTPMTKLKNEDGFYDFDAVRAFILEHEFAVGAIGWEKQAKRAQEKQEMAGLKKVRKVELETKNP